MIIALKMLLTTSVTMASAERASSKHNFLQNYVPLIDDQLVARFFMIIVSNRKLIGEKINYNITCKLLSKIKYIF
jgi:hypothetical protein